jgi:hypothetical protein
MPVGDRQMQKEPSFKVGVLPAACAGGGNGSSARLVVKAPRHQRSRSLSSIQSGDGGSLRDGDDEDTVSAELPQLQQQQRQEELSVPSVPPVTSPFARVSHMQQHTGALERCGFGSTISLHAGTPPSSHRWNQQQHLLWQQAQVQAHAHAHVTDASSTTSSRGQGGPGSGGSPATTATPLSAVGLGGGSFPGTTTAGGGGSGSAAGDAAAAGVSKVVAAAAAVQPPFLDMVPWYSGTSADLFKTMFDLLISVKLFLGRFDMRTMQVGLSVLNEFSRFCGVYFSGRQDMHGVD